MDPRMAQRRRAVVLDRERRRRRIVVAIGGAVAFGATVLAISRSPLMDVDRVDLVGLSATPRVAVLEAARLDQRAYIVDVRPDKVERAVEALPWVQRATVTIAWPSRVGIEVLERTPVASVPSAAGGWALADATGRILENTGEPPAELPRVTTVVGAGAPGATADPRVTGGLRVVAEFPPALTGRVPEVVVDEAGDVELKLDGKVPVKFGAARDIAPKLVALATLLERANVRGASSIDVRVPTAPVLTRG